MASSEPTQNMESATIEFTPRVLRQRPSRIHIIPMLLYHFTRREFLSSILAHGLDQGDVPLTENSGVNGVCLTEIADTKPQAQPWARSTDDKLNFRLTVAVEPSERLLRWKYVPQKLKMSRAWWRILTDCGGGDPYKWWIFFGTIAPGNILSVWDSRRSRDLTSAELAAIRQEPRQRGELVMDVQVVSYEEALR